MKTIARTLILTSAIALPLFASIAAHAGTTISDARYWPAQTGSVQSQTSPFLSNASSPFDAQASIGNVVEATKSVGYLGGPKTGIRVFQ